MLAAPASQEHGESPVAKTKGKILADIFVSYRRSDAAGHCGRLVDELEKAFPGSKIFRDLESIEAGTDFVQAIETAVGSCVVLLAVIGPRWLSATNSAGERRLELADDFVRHEITTALQRKIRVIPVLVDGASPVTAKDLPAAIGGLSRIHAHELSEKRWDYDVEQLLRILKRIPSLSAEAAASAAPASNRTGGAPRARLALAVGAVIALVTLTLGLVSYWRRSAGASEPPVTPERSRSAVTRPSQPESTAPTGKPLESAKAVPAPTASPPKVALKVVPNTRASDRAWPVYANLDEVGRNAAAKICKLYGGAEVGATCLRSRQQRVSLVLRVESAACSGYISSDAFVENNMLPKRKLSALPTCP